MNKLQERIKELESVQQKFKGDVLVGIAVRKEIKGIQFAQEEILKMIRGIKDVRCQGKEKEFINGSNWCNDLWKDKIKALERKIKGD